MNLSNDHIGHIKATPLSSELSSFGIQISLRQLYYLLVHSHSWTIKFFALEVFLSFSVIKYEFFVQLLYYYFKNNFSYVFLKNKAILLISHHYPPGGIFTRP